MASVGRAGLASSSLVGAIINYHLMRLRLSPAVIHPDYFLAYVRGAKTVREYLRHVNHGATRDGINTEQLLSMPVALPPYPEQLRILAEVERRALASWHMRRIRLRRRFDALPHYVARSWRAPSADASHQIPAIGATVG